MPDSSSERVRYCGERGEGGFFSIDIAPRFFFKIAKKKKTGVIHGLTVSVIYDFVVIIVEI